jgi:hypothetical protein
MKEKAKTFLHFSNALVIRPNLNLALRHRFPSLYAIEQGSQTRGPRHHKKL